MLCTKGHIERGTQEHRLSLRLARHHSGYEWGARSKVPYSRTIFSYSRFLNLKELTVSEVVPRNKNCLIGVIMRWRGFCIMVQQCALQMEQRSLLFFSMKVESFPKISPMLVLKLAFFHGWDCNDSRRGLSQFGQDSEMRNRCFFMRDWRVDIRAREWNIPYWRVTDRSVTYEDLFCVTWSRPLADVRGHV